MDKGQNTLGGQPITSGVQPNQPPTTSPGAMVPGGDFVSFQTSGYPNTVQPVSSGTGDIILSTDDGSSGKSRKGLVILLIVLVLLVVGAGVGFVVWQGGGGGDDDQASDVNDNGDNNDTYDDGAEILDLKFNTFINYMVDGEESDSSVENISPTTDYHIDENYENLEYLSQLSVFYDDFWNNISELEKQRFSGVPVSRIREYLDFLLGESSVDSGGFDGTADKALRLIKRASQGAIEALRGSVSEVAE